MDRFTVGVHERLEGAVAFDAATYPPEYTIKGMFCARLAEA